MYTFDTTTTLQLIKAHHEELRRSSRTYRRWHRG
jgi:hypothetical protein